MSFFEVLFKTSHSLPRQNSYTLHWQSSSYFVYHTYIHIAAWVYTVLAGEYSTSTTCSIPSYYMATSRIMKHQRWNYKLCLHLCTLYSFREYRPLYFLVKIQFLLSTKLRPTVVIFLIFSLYFVFWTYFGLFWHAQNTSVYIIYIYIIIYHIYIICIFYPF